MRVTDCTDRIQLANHFMTAGLLLSVVAGIGVAVLGHARGGGEFWRWCGLGVAVAGFGEGAVLLTRASIDGRPSKPMTTGGHKVEEAIGKLPHTLPGVPMPQSTQEAYDELLTGSPNRLGNPISDQIFKVVDQEIEGKSYLEINSHICQLNQQRLQLWSQLSSEVRSPEDWQKREVQELYSDLLGVTVHMSEVILRSLEARYPEAVSGISREELIGRHIGGQDALGYFGFIGEMNHLYHVAAGGWYCSDPVKGTWVKPTATPTRPGGWEAWSLSFQAFVARVEPLLDKTYLKGTTSTLDDRYSRLVEPMRSI